MSDDVKTPSAGSDLRAARVARTETELMDAARSLFLQQGYVATTLAQIAERAGLAVRTVYVRFGTKAALFRRVVDRALVGDADPIDVAHRPRTQDAMTAPTLAERIDALAEVSVGIAGRAGALFEVAAQAEGLEPELAHAAQAGRRATAELCQAFWEHAAADGLLADGADLARLALLTDTLSCADTVVHLRRAHGWSGPAHRALIVDTLAALTRPAL
jgi:AcrR family transcriptional regulator